MNCSEAGTAILRQHFNTEKGPKHLRAATLLICWKMVKTDAGSSFLIRKEFVVIIVEA